MNRTANNDWQRVRTIFDDALRQPVEERANFVRRACDGDEPLRVEVESLLDSLNSAERFLETPAVIQVAENSLGREHLLSGGEMLGYYEIQKLIGSGGMGDVYLARDTRLNRNVAVKLLRPSFLPDAQANRRLLREARTAALLEHPNICQIYEISETNDHSFIVMQYVVGTTLADILAKGKLGAAAALDLAIQILAGLAEAHSQSIIHRDIKPANIIVTDKGQAKILDFGLAKFIEAETKAETLQRLNSSGAVMGTVPFMSPEQLRGKPVDERTDIFSFGALLYEMLSGELAFSRDSNAETISAILNDEPDWSPIPDVLVPTLRQCLEKDVGRRYKSAHDVAEDLRDAHKKGKFDTKWQAATTAPGGRVATDDSGVVKKRQYHFWQSLGGSSDNASENRSFDRATGRWQQWKRRVNGFAVSAASLIVLAVGIAIVWIWQTNKSTSTAGDFDALRPVRLISWKTAAITNSTDVRLSHDGKMVAYSSSRRGGDETIYIKQTSGGEEFQVTKDAWVNISPLWSPDNQQIAFVSLRQGQSGIYVSQILGGVVTPLKVTERANIALRHWSRDGSSIYYEQAGNLYRLDIATREATRVTSLIDSVNNNDRYFSFSPDETRLAFCDTRDGQKDVWTMPLSGGDPTRVTNDEAAELRPVWHPDGKRILYNIFRNDFVQINLATADGRTPPAQVTRGEGHYVLIDLSPEGDRIYYSSAEKKSDISRVDLETLREIDIASESEVELWTDVSPDGNAIVYHVNSSPNPTRRIDQSKLVIKMSDGRKTELAGKGFDARWLPDSRHLVVFRLSETKKDEYEAWLIDTVTGIEKRMTDEYVMSPSTSVMPIMRFDIGVLDFSPDGQRVVYLDTKNPRNAHMRQLETGESIDLTKNGSAFVDYFSPTFSPDGKYIALVSWEQFDDKARDPVRRVQIFDADMRPRDIFSTTDSVRLIGWSTSNELVLASTKGVMGGAPLDLDIVAVSTTGTSRRLFGLEQVYSRTLTLSADGKTLAFVARRENRDDIWTIPVSGGEPRRVTSNGSSHTFLVNPVFSPDGRTIYFDKQEEVRAVSMFENFE